MATSRMVHLITVHSSFHARVIAARLGSDGLLTELRGAVDGPYPMGDVTVLVHEADAATAREILLVEEVEAALESEWHGLEDRHPRWTSRRIVALAGLSFAALLIAGRTGELVAHVLSQVEAQPSPSRAPGVPGVRPAAR